MTQQRQHFLNTSYESVVKEAEKKKTPEKKEERVAPPKNRKSRQEMVEDHLLTLILQSQRPKDAMAAAVNVLDTVDLMTPNPRSIFNTLKEYFITSDILSVAEISTLLHESVLPAFDLYFLVPIAQFPSEEIHLLEVEKIALSVKQSAVKDRLKVLSDKMKTAEGKQDEEELQKLREEFSTLATHFK